MTFLGARLEPDPDPDWRGGIIRLWGYDNVLWGDFMFYVHPHAPDGTSSDDSTTPLPHCPLPSFKPFPRRTDLFPSCRGWQWAEAGMSSLELALKHVHRLDADELPPGLSFGTSG